MSNRIVESLYRVSGVQLNESNNNLKFTSMASEHKDIYDREHGLPHEEAHKLFDITRSKWYTYAMLDSPIGRLPIAVVDNNGSRLKFKKYQRPWVVSHPVWDWIAEKRTPEQQKFIDEHIEEIDKAFKEYIIDIGF